MFRISIYVPVEKKMDRDASLEYIHSQEKMLTVGGGPSEK